MVKINLIGGVDKRVISYPLIRCLNLLGRTLVVTDDGVYRRFADDYGSRFEVGATDFIVTPFIEEDEEKLGVNFSIYDYVLYITTCELISEAKVIYCHGNERAIVPPRVLSEITNIEHVDVLITMVGKAPKGVNHIGYSKEVMTYICECEEQHEFVPCVGKSFGGMLVKFFVDSLGVPGDTITKVLSRKE